MVATIIITRRLVHCFTTVVKTDFAIKASKRALYFNKNIKTE